jgi:hypothetical protein
MQQIRRSRQEVSNLKDLSIALTARETFVTDLSKQQSALPCPRECRDVISVPANAKICNEAKHRDKQNGSWRKDGKAEPRHYPGRFGPFQRYDEL